MTDTDFSIVRGRVARITKLDACGNPLAGPTNQVTTKGLISVGFSAQTDEGTTISVTNANGDECIHDAPAPKLTGYNLEVALCGVSPTLVQLLTGQALVQDSSQNNVGFDIGTDVVLDGIRFAIELWSAVPGQACVGGVPSYGYFLAPLVQGGQLGDFTWQNDAINFTVSNAATKDGNAWGVGPYNVILGAGGTPSPLLTPIGTNKHLRVISTQLAPPTNYGAGAVGVPATSEVAGIPGHPMPTNSYNPTTLAAMTGLTASPNTAWTTGQYVYLQDGTTKVHWTGTAWAAGAA